MDILTESRLRPALSDRRCRRKWRTFWVIATAVAVTAAIGSDRRHVNPNEPLTLHGTPDVKELGSQTFRIGTFNIHGGKGTDGLRDLGRTAATLHGLDIVTLQEVRSNPFDGRNDQATELGDRLGMASLFLPTERRWWTNHFGNGLLTRVELTGVHLVPLHGTQSKRYRNAVIANFRHRGQTVHVLAAHLDNLDDHDVQLAAICDLFFSLAEPAVLIGDLNTGAHNPQVQRLLSHPEVTCAVGEEWPDREPLRGVDWIIGRGLRCVDHECRDHGGSDHAAVCATLELIPSVRPTYSTAYLDERQVGK